MLQHNTCCHQLNTLCLGQYNPHLSHSSAYPGYKQGEIVTICQIQMKCGKKNFGSAWTILTFLQKDNECCIREVILTVELNSCMITINFHHNWLNIISLWNASQVWFKIFLVYSCFFPFYLSICIKSWKNHPLKSFSFTTRFREAK